MGSSLLQGILSMLWVGTALTMGCHSGRTPVAVADPRYAFAFPDGADCSGLTWTAGFQAAHTKFSREYVFTQWKGVDWPALYNQFYPRIVQAEATGDARAYYLALHDYVCSIPDGHVNLKVGDDPALRPGCLNLIRDICQSLLGGSYGLALAELDDGRTIAAAVAPLRAAAQVGMRPGAEILTWGGRSPAVAIGAIKVGATPYRLLA
jgi:carboxyl-terminal processing protease